MNNSNDQNNETCNHQPRHGKGFWAAVLLAVIAGIGATAVWAGGHFGHGDWDSAERIDFMVERMTDRLDLSDEQQTKIEAILTASQADAKPYREELETLRTDMRELVEADEYYEDQVRVKLTTKAQAMVELGVIASRTMHDVRAELTPEQRAEADALMARFTDKGGRRGMWRHRHSDEDA